MRTDLPSTSPTGKPVSFRAEYQHAPTRITHAPNDSSGQHAPAPTLAPAVRAKRMVNTVRMLAARMARRLPQHVDRDELVSAGSLGLADAFTRRGDMSGQEFEAFAACRIRGAMLDELRRLDAMSRGSRRAAKLMAVARRTVEQRLGRSASEEEIAAELGVDLKSYRSTCALVASNHAPVYFSALGNEDDDGLRDVVDPSNEMPEAFSARSQMSAIIAEQIAALPERTRAVMMGLYVEGRTLKEIGVALGVTESRVCQIHKETLAELRSMCGAENGVDE
jgi:RNA polymerase sigma factor for flagellar operon FliA